MHQSTHRAATGAGDPRHGARRGAVAVAMTFNGPATIGVTTGAGAAASSSFDVMFSNFTVSQDARSAPTQTQMNGDVTSACFGGTVTLTTRAPLTQMAGTPCPSAGILRATAA